MVHAILNEIYFPLNELSFNQQRLRYASLGLEIYYGHWAHVYNENELVGNSEYISTLATLWKMEILCYMQ